MSGVQGGGRVPAVILLFDFNNWRYLGQAWVTAVARIEIEDPGKRSEP